jgi:hypothetical protein
VSDASDSIPAHVLHRKLIGVAELVRGQYEDDVVGRDEWIDEFGSLMAAIETLADQHAAQAERLAQLEEEVASLRSLVQNDSKQAKVANILRNARNKADTKQTGVVMGYKDIMAATGVSSTMAYNYIDSLPTEYPFLHDREDLPTHVEEDSLAKDRGLVVDLSTVEDETSVFNRLLNDHGGKGGSA